MVVVAQLVRALDCGSRGRGFETHQAPQSGSLGSAFLISEINFFYARIFSFIEPKSASIYGIITHPIELEI